jgi:hypothetical protein
MSRLKRLYGDAADWTDVLSANRFHVTLNALSKAVVAEYLPHDLPLTFDAIVREPGIGPHFARRFIDLGAVWSREHWEKFGKQRRY